MSGRKLNYRAALWTVFKCINILYFLQISKLLPPNVSFTRSLQIKNWSCFLPPKCTCSFTNWPTVSFRVAIKINGYNCGSLSPLCSPTHWPFSSSPSSLYLAVVRVPADEDRTAQAQHIYHSLPAVDHCHRAHLPCWDPRREASNKHTHLPAHRALKHKFMQRFGCHKTVKPFLELCLSLHSDPYLNVYIWSLLQTCTRSTGYWQSTCLKLPSCW